MADGRPIGCTPFAIGHRLSAHGNYSEHSYCIAPRRVWGGEGRGERGGNKFVKGFVTASLVFCVGPMTILGSIQDGLRGDIQLLAIKSMLDGFAAIPFAAPLG